jgi:alanine-synthesizing transaminase
MSVFVAPTSSHAVPHVRRAERLHGVHYEIRGPLARRALEIERAGHNVIKLNIGNPAQFGFRAPEAMRAAIVEKLPEAEGYGHQKGLLQAREAVMKHALSHGLAGVTVEDVFIGNGASELILMCMEALLEPGDEVLLPAPDYPLWTAAVSLTGARAAHYPCRPENGFVPDAAEVERMIGPRTRALVIINPNNPTGTVYPRDAVSALVRVAERRRLVLFSDEMYDRILYDGAAHVPAASLCEGTLCATFGGLSKVHLACGFRTGWVVFTGRKRDASDYLAGIELLASLRLCPNLLGQWAVPAALDGPPTILELTAETGRLGRQRRALLRGIERSRFFRLVPPRGALYAFPRVDRGALPGFDDKRFAMELLEREHVLVLPGSGFNVTYTDHLRLTFLPDEDTLGEVFVRMERLLTSWA